MSFRCRFDIAEVVISSRYRGDAVAISSATLDETTYYQLLIKSFRLKTNWETENKAIFNLTMTFPTRCVSQLPWRQTRAVEEEERESKVVCLLLWRKKNSIQNKNNDRSSTNRLSASLISGKEYREAIFGINYEKMLLEGRRIPRPICNWSIASRDTDKKISTSRYSSSSDQFTLISDE